VLNRHRNLNTYRSLVAQMPSSMAMLLGMIVGDKRSIGVFQNILAAVKDSRCE
jgi:hypothetical protein